MTDGVLNIKKEKGMTSFAVVYKLKKLLKADKIGHTGTLDPDATGVLPICMGKATKLVGRLTDSDKTYKAVMLLGRKTDTQDISGKTIEEVSADRVRETMDFLSGESKDTLGYKHALHKIESAFALLTGTIEQLPPMYSALKVNGQRLYELARQGVTVERKKRSIEIYNIDIISIELPRVVFLVTCSKGTYIRTLCDDIGEKLGCGACMESLKRTASGRFKIEDAHRLSEIQSLVDNGKLDEVLIGMDEVFAELQAYRAVEYEDKILHNGNRLKSKKEFPLGTRLRVYDSKDCFIGIYELEAGNILKPIKILCE